MFKKFVFLLMAIPLTTDWLYDYNNHTSHRLSERQITNSTTRTHATNIICGYRLSLLVVWTKFVHHQGHLAIKKVLLRLYIKFRVTWQMHSASSDANLQAEFACTMNTEFHIIYCYYTLQAYTYLLFTYILFPYISVPLPIPTPLTYWFTKWHSKMKRTDAENAGCSKSIHLKNVCMNFVTELLSVYATSIRLPHKNFVLTSCVTVHAKHTLTQ